MPLVDRMGVFNTQLGILLCTGLKLAVLVAEIMLPLR